MPRTLLRNTLLPLLAAAILGTAAATSVTVTVDDDGAEVTIRHGADDPSEPADGNETNPPGNDSRPPGNRTDPPGNGTRPPPGNRTDPPPRNDTSPPGNHTQPPSNGTGNGTGNGTLPLPPVVLPPILPPSGNETPPDNSTGNGTRPPEDPPRPPTNGTGPPRPPANETPPPTNSTQGCACGSTPTASRSDLEVEVAMAWEAVVASAEVGGRR